VIGGGWAGGKGAEGIGGTEGIRGVGTGGGGVRVATGDDRRASNGDAAALGEVYPRASSAGRDLRGSEGRVATGVPTGTGPSWRVPGSTSSSTKITSGGVLETPTLAGSDTAPVPFSPLCSFLLAIGIAGTEIGEDENLGTREGTEAGSSGSGRWYWNCGMGVELGMVCGLGIGTGVSTRGAAVGDGVVGGLLEGTSW